MIRLGAISIGDVLMCNAQSGKPDSDDAACESLLCVERPDSATTVPEDRKTAPADRPAAFRNRRRDSDDSFIEPPHNPRISMRHTSATISVVLGEPCIKRPAETLTQVDRHAGRDVAEL